MVQNKNEVLFMYKKPYYCIFKLYLKFFILLVSSAFCTQSIAEDARSVVGQFESNGNFICGAVLVAPRVVLASAYCFQSPGTTLGGGVIFRLGSQTAVVERKSTPANWENIYIPTPVLNFEGSRYDGITVVRLKSPINIAIFPKLWFGQFDLIGETMSTMVRLRSGAYTLKNQTMGSSGVPSAIITYQTPVISAWDDRTNPLFITWNGALYLLGFLESAHYGGTTTRIDYTLGKLNIYTGLAHVPARRFILDNPIISDLAPFNIVPPEYLSVQKTSDTSLTISWQDRSSNETAFQIFRSNSPESAGTLLAQVGTNVASFTDTSILSNTQYCYQVRSVSGSNLSLPLESVCQIVRPTPSDSTPAFVDSLEQIDIDGNTICGVDTDSQIFCADSNIENNPNWFLVPGILKQVSVSSGRLMGVTTSGEIYFAANYRKASWVLIPGLLSQVDLDGNVVCGNHKGAIYCADQNIETNPNWFQITGYLEQLSISAGRITGVAIAVNGGPLYFTDNYRNVNWVSIPGALKQITLDGNVLCGVNGGNLIYCADQNISTNPNWRQLSGSLRQVSVSGNRIIGVNGGNWIYIAMNYLSVAWTRVLSIIP